MDHQGPAQAPREPSSRINQFTSQSIPSYGATIWNAQVSVAVVALLLLGTLSFTLSPLLTWLKNGTNCREEYRHPGLWIASHAGLALWDPWRQSTVHLHLARSCFDRHTPSTAGDVKTDDITCLCNHRRGRHILDHIIASKVRRYCFTRVARWTALAPYLCPKSAPAASLCVQVRFPAHNAWSAL